MRRVLASLVLATLCLTKALAVGDEPPGEVLVLNDANFESVASQHDVLLVEFYAPWCGHCKALEPKYNEAAALLAKDDATKNIRIAKFDADADKSVPGRFGVSGFPTLKLLRNGELAGDFDGDRTAEAIVEFMRKKAASATNKEMTDGAALKKLLKVVAGPTVVALCSSTEHVDYKIFKSVVSKFADTGLEVYHASAPSVLETFGFYSSGCTIQLYLPAAKKPKKVSYSGTLFKDKLRTWVLDNAVGPMSVYTADTQKLYSQSGKNLLRFVKTNAAKSLAGDKALMKVAAGYPDFLFAVSEAGDHSTEVEAHCGATAKGATCLLLHDAKKSQVYGRVVSTATEAEVKEFLDDFAAKKLKAKIKSEPVPAPANAGEVIVVVGTTFEQEVIQADKDVLIEFYAPWCGHCKALAPKYEELAKDVAEQTDLAIAKFDMTSNDIPAEYKNAFSVQGFPTLYFAQRGKKSTPEKYEGGREVDAFKAWLAEKRA